MDVERFAGIAPLNRAAEQAGGLELAPLARLDGKAELPTDGEILQALGRGVVELEYHGCWVAGWKLVSKGSF